MIGADQQRSSRRRCGPRSERRVDPMRTLCRLQNYCGNSRRLGFRKIDRRLPMAEVDHKIRRDRRNVGCGPKIEGRHRGARNEMTHHC